MTASALDGVAGLGEIRRKALLRRFGSLKRLGGGQRRRDRRGARHRPAYRGGDRRRARPSGDRRRRPAGGAAGVPDGEVVGRSEAGRRTTVVPAPAATSNRCRASGAVHRSGRADGGESTSRGRLGRRSRARPGAPSRADTDLVIVTGVSGGGRSTVARALENVGFYVVDNLPQALMLDMAELAFAGRRRGPAHRDGARRAQPRLLHRPRPARSGRCGSAASRPGCCSSTPTTRC